MAFPFLTIFLLFLGFLAVNRMKTMKKERSIQEEFWQKEEEANATRRKDISSLPYIVVPLHALPFEARPDDEELLRCEEGVRALSEQKILNLTGLSNTELKLNYGAANLTFLTQCDQNFTDLVRLMQQWGARLYELALPAQAEQVLTLSVGWGSDIKGSYLLLAQIYQESGQWDKLPQLKERASHLKSLMKEPILDALNQL